MEKEILVEIRRIGINGLKRPFDPLEESLEGEKVLLGSENFYF